MKNSTGEVGQSVGHSVKLYGKLRKGPKPRWLLELLCVTSLFVFQIRSCLFYFEEYCCRVFKRIKCCQDVGTNPVHNSFYKRHILLLLLN